MPHARARIKDAQTAILTGAEELELGEEGCHISLRDGYTLPYEFQERLGSGGCGEVDKVLSRLSGKEYARKLIIRRAFFPNAAVTMERFVKEIEGLKRVKHRHMVAFIGSYTDENYLGLLMMPVADCNLATYLENVGTSGAHKPLLRSFFGCLVTGLAHLHDCRIRHKDIKPENILVKQQNILFTDFGLVRDSSDASNSISVGATPRTPEYCAPEVASFDRRDSSSDVWSLGCVFLEMVSSLKGRTKKDLRSYYRDHGSRSMYLWDNRESYEGWIFDLRDLSELDNKPLEWVNDMVQQTADIRPTAQAFVNRIIGPGGELHFHPQYCGICCRTPATLFTLLKRAADRSKSRNETAEIVKHPKTATVESNSGRRIKRKRSSQPDFVKSSLLASKSPKKSQIDRYAWSAAKKGDTERVARLLAQGGSPNFVNDDGTSTLHWAARNGCVEMFNALIARGADHDVRDCDGLSVLSYAVDSANVDIIQKLLQLNASNHPDNQSTTPLCLAAELGRETIIPILLQYFRADLDHPDHDGGIRLAWAAFNGNLKAVQILAENGALVNRSCTRWGRTPLSWAAENGHAIVISYLIEVQDADPDSIALDTGRAPFSYACEKGHLEMVLALLKSRAIDIGRRDKVGKSALDYAKLSKRKMITAALLDFEQR